MLVEALKSPFLIANVGTVVKGKEPIVRLALVAAICEGHVLFEDVPGTAKTYYALARIFGLSMQPELVSIAGVYRTFDEGFPAELARQPAQIRLVGDRIDISSLGSATR